MFRSESSQHFDSNHLHTATKNNKEIIWFLSFTFTFFKLLFVLFFLSQQLATFAAEVLLRSSEALEERLDYGALLQELEMKGSRLRYRKIYGKGPEVGWISTLTACTKPHERHDDVQMKPFYWKLNQRNWSPHHLRIEDHHFGCFFYVVLLKLYMLYCPFKNRRFTNEAPRSMAKNWSPG